MQSILILANISIILIHEIYKSSDMSECGMQNAADVVWLLKFWQ